MSRKALGRGLSALFPQVPALEQEMVEVPIDLIDPSSDQPRQAFNDHKLEELAASIRANGIIQPIVVRRNGARFQLIAGERRWRAAQRAGTAKIPCIVKEVPDERVLELSLIENIQREELNAIEEAQAYKRLMERLRATQEEIARRVGKDRSSIANSLRLLKLPKEVQALVEQDKLSMGHARALLALDSADKQIALARQIASGSISVRDTERVVKAYMSPGSESGRATRKSSPERANVAAAETRLARRLGAPVKIKFSGKGGAIEIRFSSPDDLSRLYDLLIARSTVA